MLDRQKYAADRSARYHMLAWLRTLEGYYGAAKFYQFEAARWHLIACKHRNTCNIS